MVLNCNQIVLDLSSPAIMAIINITEDSFFDGGQISDLSSLFKTIDLKVKQGAHILDFGAMSSRPGAVIVDPADEFLKLESAIRYTLDQHPQMIISIDTLHSTVARRCIEMGVHMINDISGGQYDSDMLHVVGRSNVAYVGMHMRGNPSNMQTLTDYPDGVSLEVVRYFSQLLRASNKAGINDIILDPGFGFAKTIEQNYQLLNQFGALKIYNRPILVGISRKSMIYKVLGINPEAALNGTSALHMMALENGANILRVHDVPACMECIQLYECLKANQ